MVLFPSLCCVLLLWYGDNRVNSEALRVDTYHLLTAKSVRQHVKKSRPDLQLVNIQPVLKPVQPNAHHSHPMRKYSSMNRDNSNNHLEKTSPKLRQMLFSRSRNLKQKVINVNDGRSLYNELSSRDKKEDRIDFNKLKTLIEKQTINENYAGTVNYEKTHYTGRPSQISNIGLEIRSAQVENNVDHLAESEFKSAIQLKYRSRSIGAITQQKSRLPRSISSDVNEPIVSHGRHNGTLQLIIGRDAKQIQLYPTDRSNDISLSANNETLLLWLCRLGSQRSCDCVRLNIPWFKCARHFHRTLRKYSISRKFDRNFYRDDNRQNKHLNGNHKYFPEAKNITEQLKDQGKDDDKRESVRLKRGITQNIEDVLMNNTTTVSYIKPSVNISDTYDNSQRNDSHEFFSKDGGGDTDDTTRTNSINQENTEATNLNTVSKKLSDIAPTDNSLHYFDGYVSPVTADPGAEFHYTELNTLNSRTVDVTDLNNITDMEILEQDTLYHVNKTIDNVPEKQSGKDDSVKVENILPKVAQWNQSTGTNGFDILNSTQLMVQSQTYNDVRSSYDNEYTKSDLFHEITVYPTNLFNITYVKPLLAVPQPDWVKAKQVWQGAWGFHVYGVGVAFAILTIYLIVSIVRLHRMKNFLSQGYFFALMSIILVMSFFRAIYFLIDGYNSNKTFPAVVSYFLYTVSLPCITSAFCILFLALLNSTKMQLLSKRIQKPSFIAGIIIFHFLLQIVTDFIVGSFYRSRVMFFICQIAFVLWGLILFGGYIYIFRKLFITAKRRQKEMERLSLSKVKLQGISPFRRPPKLALSLAIKVTLVTAIFGLLMAALQVYALTGMHNVFSTEKPHPWPWWWFNFGVRLVEIGMCITMSFVATQPFRYHQTEKQNHLIHDLFYMSPCKRLCECDSYHVTGNHDIYWDDNSTICFTDEENQIGVSNFNTENHTEVATNTEEMRPLNNQNGCEGEANGTLPTSTSSRPQSLLVSENGFIRFRQENDVDVESIIMSTDDELDKEDLEDIFSYANQNHDFPKSNKIDNDSHDYQSVPMSPSGEGILPTIYNVNNNNRHESLYKLSDLNEYSTQHLVTKELCDFDNMDRSSAVNTPLSDGHDLEDYTSLSNISFRPPSSINLGRSIENALNMSIVDIDINDNSQRDDIHSSRRCSESDILDVTDMCNRNSSVKKYSRSIPNSRVHQYDNSSMTSDTDLDSVKTPLYRSKSDTEGDTSKFPNNFNHMPCVDVFDDDTCLANHKNVKTKRSVEDESSRNEGKKERRLDSSFSDVCFAIDQLNSQTHQDFHYL